MEYNHLTHFRCPYCGEIHPKSGEDTVIVPLKEYTHLEIKPMSEIRHYTTRYSFSCKKCERKNTTRGMLIGCPFLLCFLAGIPLTFFISLLYESRLLIFVGLILEVLLLIAYNKIANKMKIVIGWHDAEECDSFVTELEYEMYKNKIVK